MSDDALTLERIDELLRFLPILSESDGDLETGWAGGEEMAKDVFTTTYPVYSDVVLDFFRTAGQTWWMDYHYANRPASKKLGNADFIATCSLDDLRILLTACVRGERFSDGFWAHCLQTGVVFRLLQRLAEIRTDFD